MLGAQPDRRYQVFISSTYLDLKEERQEVTKAVLELNCFPGGMELFPASDDEKWDLIKRVIDDSDYYIVILGGRYGSVDDEGLSFTEKEYDYAVSVKKPVLGFVHGDPGQIVQSKSELDPKARKRLDAFRRKVEKRMCKHWKTPEELGSVVSRSLVREIGRRPAVGWVRGDNALTAEVIEELSTLRQQAAETEAELDRSRTTAPEGAVGLAKGSEVVETNYSFENAAFDVKKGTTVRTRYSGSVFMAWDQIFRTAGPSLMDEAEDASLWEKLNMLATAAYAEEADWPEGSNSRFVIQRSSYEQIVVQLVALGFIKKSERKRGVNVRGTFWTLTPYGETHLMTLLAIPTGSTSSLPPSDRDDGEREDSTD